MNSPSVDTNQTSGYPLLCLDVEGTDFWSRLDGVVDWCTRRSNPILIKEARQALKSRQFILTFFALLLATWSWSVVGVAWGMPEIRQIPSGQWMLAGYYMILAVPMLAIVPLAAHQSLASELDDGTFELLLISNLSARKIVLGKLGSSMLQMLVYFAAVAPSFAFSYLLRGVDLGSIGLILVVVFFSATLLASFGLMLGVASTNKVARIFSLLLLLGAIFWSELLCGIVCIEGILQQEFPVNDPLSLGLFGFFVALAISFIALFLLATMSRIAPAVENRSTKLRICMFVQQLVWVMGIVAMAIMEKELDILATGIVMLGWYWISMGTMMLAESSELSPRTLRGLPATFLLRALFTWFNPGPGTGYLFATLSGLCGMAVMAVTEFVIDAPNNERPSLAFLLMSAYLLFYLGLAWLILLVLPRQVERSFPLVTVLMILLLLAGIFMPFVVDVILTGGVDRYEVMHLTNWFWTTVEIFDGRWNMWIGFLGLFWIICAGIFLLNLFFLFRELSFRRIATPLRVLQDRSQSKD